MQVSSLNRIRGQEPCNWNKAIYIFPWRRSTQYGSLKEGFVQLFDLSHEICLIKHTILYFLLIGIYFFVEYIAILSFVLT
jgi:hypothetical protein